MTRLETKARRRCEMEGQGYRMSIESCVVLVLGIVHRYIHNYAGDWIHKKRRLDHRSKLVDTYNTAKEKTRREEKEKNRISSSHPMSSICIAAISHFRLILYSGYILSLSVCKTRCRKSRPTDRRTTTINTSDNKGKGGSIGVDLSTGRAIPAFVH
jgi:hypothetical protein